MTTQGNSHSRFGTLVGWGTLLAAIGTLLSAIVNLSKQSDRLNTQLDALKAENTQFQARIEELKLENKRLQSIIETKKHPLYPDESGKPTNEVSPGEEKEKGESNSPGSLQSQASVTYGNIVFTLNECIRDNSLFTCKLFVKNISGGNQTILVYANHYSSIADNAGNIGNARDAFFVISMGNSSRVFLVPEGGAPLVINFVAPHYESKQIEYMHISSSIGGMEFRNVKYIDESTN